MRSPLQVATSRMGYIPRRHLRHTQQEDFSVYAPAKFVQRWYALTLDLALSTPLEMMVKLPFNRRLEHLFAYGHEVRSLLLATIITLLPIAAYFVVPTWLYGQTLGKRIVGLRVVRSDFNAQLSLGEVLLRETVGKALSILTLGVGVVMMEGNARRRTLHDLLGSSMVIAYKNDEM